MIDLQLDITDLEDIKSEKNRSIQEEFYKVAVSFLSSGNRVIVKRVYLNSPSDFIRVFVEKADFDDFWKKL